MGGGWIVSWRWLPALLLTTVMPLTVHVVMLNAGIPHPGPVPDRSLVTWSSDFCTAAGALLLLGWAPPGLARRSVGVRAVVVLLLIAGMRGHVFRDPFMDFVNTKAPALSLSTLGIIVDDYLPVVPLAIIAILVTALPPFRAGRSLVLRALLASLVAWVVTDFVVTPALQPLVSFLDKREGAAIFLPPYGWRIQVPAYATFAENAVTAIIAATLSWRQIGGGRLRRVGASVFMILLIVGPVTRPLIDAWRGPDPWIGFLSPFQFTLETIVLGLLAGLSCLFCLGMRAGAGPVDGIG